MGKNDNDISMIFNGITKGNKGDEEASIIGDIFFGILKAGYSYCKYSFIGIKKVVLSKLKTKKSVAVTSMLGFFSATSIVTTILIKNGKVEFNWVTLGTLLTGIVYLPLTACLLPDKLENFDYSINDDFEEIYDKMGFKDDFEKGLKNPYCLGIKEDKKGNTIYSFKANYNKISTFEKGVDLIESVVNQRVVEIRKNENNRSIIEIVCRKKDIKPERLNIFTEIKRFIADYNCIPIDSETIWNYRDCPHGLITGITKGGKTSMLFYLIRQLLTRKVKLRIIDPKKSALSYTENYIGKDCASENEDIIKLIQNFVKDMDQRFRDMKKHKDYRPMTDYFDYGFQPNFLIFDEVMSFFGGSSSNEDKKTVNDCLVDIIAKGREAGYFVILTTQRADTNYIKGSLRDQLGLRMSLGSLSGDGYKMTFGRTDFKLKDTTKGAGFIYLDGTGMDKAQEFTSPYMLYTKEQKKQYNLKEYDFFEDFQNLLGKSTVKKVVKEDIKTEIKDQDQENEIKLIDIKTIKELKLSKKSNK